MRLLNKLLHNPEKLTEAELDAQDAEARAARIADHRENVRNGPVNFRFRSVGQQRRQAARDQAASERKAARRYRRDFMRRQLETSVLRGRLQTVGALPFKDEAYIPNASAKVSATVALVAQYGERDEDGHVLLENENITAAILAAKADYESR